MRKNGFTLIELLAVIVILAIVALIATPIILGIINDAREKANERSVELYASAVRNAIASYQLTGTSAPKSFSDLSIQYDGNVECETEILYEDGNFYIADCTVNGTAIEYVYGTKKNVCKLSDEDNNGKYSIGDIISCKFSKSTEMFYVMENETDDNTPDTIDMLSMYNLYVGNIYTGYLSGPSNKSPLENPTGIQNELAKGFVGGDDTLYGLVAFSTTRYWSVESEGDFKFLPQYSSVDGDYSYVYSDDADIISPYVNSYELYLKNNGVTSANASLISSEQLVKLGCSVESGSCTSSTPKWVYSTTYWTGVASTYWVCDVEGDEVHCSSDYDKVTQIGVRPVITISTSEIQ